MGSLNEQLKAEQQNEKQLKEQVSTQKQRIKHLQAMDKSLRKTDDQLLRIQENLTSDKLFEEIASLRNTMGDMENAEVVYNQASEESRELRDQLNQEIEMTRKLKTEVEKMKTSFKSQVELERMVEDSTFKMEEVQNLLEAEKRKKRKTPRQVRGILFARGELQAGGRHAGSHARSIGADDPRERAAEDREEPGPHTTGGSRREV